MQPDPRRPAKARPYVPQLSEPETLWAMLAMMTGIFGLMLKQKIFSWVAIYCSVISFVNRRASDNSSGQQSMMSLLFSGMSLVMSYFGPQPVKLPPKL
ncbi:hypothetical protein PAPYR_8703 [Paratrimastix pyriformis]|uniref:Protein Asterix n=1 Tax=Paratrimastix pyriformis TaxID=342808 RepID=A0ABQ8UCR9_9EUKA|nr:hypothetical protein PAPYR_8703 [Paratrimastix pyriformis]